MSTTLQKRSHGGYRQFLFTIILINAAVHLLAAMVFAIWVTVRRRRRLARIAGSGAEYYDVYENSEKLRTKGKMREAMHQAKTAPATNIAAGGGAMAAMPAATGGCADGGGASGGC